jgi:UDP-glucose-4-epimerase GalE
MHVLITGGAGYIGSHTAKALAGAGFQSVVVDDLRHGHGWAVRWGPLEKADLADKALLRGIFQKYSIEAVIHFAAFAYVGESMAAPHLYFQNNVVNTINLLEVMREAGVRHLVFSSSCATYGYPERIPISEDHPQCPVNPYGESKLMVERILHWYGLAYGLAWAALRYFNAAGADPDGELGEMHTPEPHLIPRIIAAAQGALPCVDIYGVDYTTRDGTAIRDYIHVTDLAEAHVLALRFLQSGGAATAFNLGVGCGYSVREVISKVEQVSRRKVPIRESARRPGDPPALIADASKANHLLKWRPACSSLDRIVETAWNWYRNNDHKSVPSQPTC